MLGGSIAVASTPGQGSTFTIRLPLDEAEAAPASTDAAPAQSAPSEAAAPGAVTVLVVDDDPAVHEVLSNTLSKEGYRLVHAHGGAEALEIMRRERPDIVTLDVMMPKIDGWSVLGIMKSEPELAPIPVIMLTIVDDRNLGFSLGASEFMTKPVDRTRLIALIKKLAPAAPGGVVLIVDDDPAVRAMLKLSVRSVGMESADVGNGEAALAWLAAHPKPALVLLDIMMPTMDGFEFLERVRKQPEFQELPIVVLTAKELNESERTFLAENTLLILSKSAQPIGTLGSALAAIAGRRPRE
jgi:CheY-like chemotaxis protein